VKKCIVYHLCSDICSCYVSTKLLPAQCYKHRVCSRQSGKVFCVKNIESSDSPAWQQHHQLKYQKLTFKLMHMNFFYLKRRKTNTNQQTPPLDRFIRIAKKCKPILSHTITFHLTNFHNFTYNSYYLCFTLAIFYIYIVGTEM